MEITKHPRFRWMAGMLTTTGRRVVDVWESRGLTRVAWTDVKGDAIGVDDVTSSFMRGGGTLAHDDAATAGCLQSLLLAELPETESLGVNGHRVTFWNGREHCNESKTGTNLGEALCAALLTVWGEK